MLGFDPDRERSFPGQQPGEEVVLMTVFHWMKLVPFFFYLCLFVAAFVIFYYALGLSEDLSPINKLYLTTIFIAVIINVVCFRLYNYFLKIILVTNYRLIEINHSVFLRREREVIPIINIQDLRFRQKGILPRIFKYGDLIVYGASTDIKYEFKYIISVNKIHHLLNEIRLKAVEHTPQTFDADPSVRSLRGLSQED